MSEDEVNVTEEAPEEEFEKTKRKGRPKRRVKTMELPQVLKYLNGEETIALINYLHNMYWEWFEYFNTIAYAKAFDTMLQRYISMFAGAYQQTTQEQAVQTEQVTQQQTIAQPMPMNPFDSLILNFVGRVADRVYNEIESKILTNPKFREELEGIVKVIAAQVAQEVISKQMTQAATQ